MASTPSESAALDLRATELLFSRAFHDLIGPITAVNNGVEMVMEMPNAPQSDAFRLISTSAEQAAAKLSYYRLAYGAAGRDPNLTMTQVRDFAHKYFAGRKVQVDWPTTVLAGEQAPSPGVLKAVVNTLLLAEEALTRGGEIVMSADSPTVIRFEAQGRTAQLRETVLAAFRGKVPEDGLDPRSVHAWVLGIFMRDEGLSLRLEQPAEGRMTLLLGLPEAAAADAPAA